jgi:hypothetical protein
MLMVDSCGRTRICSFMHELTGKSMNTLRQCYREICYESEAKAGVKRGHNKRRALEVEACFPDLLRSVLRGWQGEKKLALALDATTLNKNFTILSISVMYRGCGIPVAWYVMKGDEKGSWRPHWERLLQSLAGVIPPEWFVLLMADRGLYADWLFCAIQANGWHPFLRVRQEYSFRPRGESTFREVGSCLKRPGRGWSSEGEWSESGERMRGTLLMRWEKGYAEAIGVVTDLLPNQARAAWYQMRFWIENEYKDRKKGWLHWEQTKMTHPERASRLWLLQAIVFQKVILLGGQLEAAEQSRQKTAPRRRRGRPARPSSRPRSREQSVLMRGMMARRAAEVERSLERSGEYAVAEAFPSRLYRVSRVPKSYREKVAKKAERKRWKQRQQGPEQERKRVQRQADAEAQRQQKAQRQANAGDQRQRKAQRQVMRQAKEGERRISEGFTKEPPVVRLCQGRLQRVESIQVQHPEAKPLLRKNDLPKVSEKRTGAAPLLCLRRGVLQPPPKPQGRENHVSIGHGPACGASP